MEVGAPTADELYRELAWKLTTSGVLEETRNGPALTIQQPLTMALWNPTQRVLLNRQRDANPFFHIAEVVWMLAGSNDVRFIEQFNSRYRDYADPGTNQVWAAYGHRWMEHWEFDQIARAIELLRANPASRQVVIQMWDPVNDLENSYPHNDRACNTQCLFRTINGKLDMTVINRSNDMVWGAMGANIVHFTYLQELIALSSRIQVGVYRVVSNNMHIYVNMPRYGEIIDGAKHGECDGEIRPTVPILDFNETWQDLYADCAQWVYEEYKHPLKTFWFCNVAMPMMEAYKAGARTSLRDEWIERVQDVGWKLAAQRWVARRVR